MSDAPDDQAGQQGRQQPPLLPAVGAASPGVGAAGAAPPAVAAADDVLQPPLQPLPPQLHVQGSVLDVAAWRYAGIWLSEEDLQLAQQAQLPGALPPLHPHAPPLPQQQLHQQLLPQQQMQQLQQRHHQHQQHHQKPEPLASHGEPQWSDEGGDDDDDDDQGQGDRGASSSAAAAGTASDRRASSDIPGGGSWAAGEVGDQASSGAAAAVGFKPVVRKKSKGVSERGGNSDSVG